MNNKWTIVYCSNQYGEFIHEEHIVKSNPKAQILKIDFSNNKYRQNLEPYAAWKQCDKVIRLWMKENKHLIKYNNVALVEYDLLITKTLPDLKLENQIIGKNVLDPVNHGWWLFFSDKNQLGYLEDYSCSIIFFCFYMMSKNCIDYWTDNKYDFLYENNVDIICELRLPTILKYNGVNVLEGDYFKNITVGEDIEFDINIPGFYHPVKKQIMI